MSMVHALAIQIPIHRNGQGEKGRYPVLYGRLLKQQ